MSLIVLKNPVYAQSLSISQNTFPLKRRSRNDVCRGGLSAKHVPVFGRDFAVTEFFNKISPYLPVDAAEISRPSHSR